VTNFPTKVLLAIDDSEEVEPATRRAIDLADTADSELHIIYVGQLPNFLMNDPDIMGFYRKLYDDIEQESLEILWRLTWEVKAAGGDVAGAHLRMGNVMGSRGHGGLRRVIEGSISDVVVRRAACAVMTVRSQQGEKHQRFWPRVFSSGSTNSG
jgi:nucleotide-binding universal stress UspA family protein